MMIEKSLVVLDLTVIFIGVLGLISFLIGNIFMYLNCGCFYMIYATFRLFFTDKGWIIK